MAKYSPLCWFLGKVGMYGVALEALLVRGGARGTRTLTAFRPGDFKSPASTCSAIAPVVISSVPMIVPCHSLFVNHFFPQSPNQYAWPYPRSLNFPTNAYSFVDATKRLMHNTSCGSKENSS